MSEKPKLGKSSNGKEMHYSAGAILKKDGKYLLVDRLNPPLGFAGLAGHIEDGETPEQALFREVKEESNLDVKSYKLLFVQEIDGNVCSRGVPVHYWYFYECEVEGEIRFNSDESKSIDWYSKDELLKLNLEPIWAFWFKKLGIL